MLCYIFYCIYVNIYLGEGFFYCLDVHQFHFIRCYIVCAQLLSVINTYQHIKMNVYLMYLDPYSTEDTETCKSNVVWHVDMSALVKCNLSLSTCQLTFLSLLITFSCINFLLLLSDHNRIHHSNKTHHA